METCARFPKIKHKRWPRRSGNRCCAHKPWDNFFIIIIVKVVCKNINAHVMRKRSEIKQRGNGLKLVDDVTRPNKTHHRSS